MHYLIMRLSAERVKRKKMRQTVKHPQPHPAHSNGSKWSEFFVPNRSGRKAPTRRTYKSILKKKTNQFYIPINRTLIGRHQPLRTSALMGPAGQDKKPSCFLIRQPVCAVVTATMGLGFSGGAHSSRTAAAAAHRQNRYH